MTGRKGFFRKKNITKWLSRIVVTLLVFSMLAAFYQMPVKAADDPGPGETAGIADTIKGSAVDNGYILDVITGVNPGKDGIAYFQIKYKSGNKNYTQFIFPREDDERMGRLKVASVGSDVPILDSIKSDYGYDTVDAWDGRGTSLRRYSQSMFYFEPLHKMDTITGIDAFAVSPDGKTRDWTCQGVRIFKVDELYGLRMAGVWSNDFYIDFKGKPIAEVVTNKYNYSFSAPDFLHLDSNGGRINTKFDNTAYKNHVTQQASTYGFRIDFADLYKAGFESLAHRYDDGQVPINKMDLAEDLTINITYTDVYGQTRFAHLPAITSTAYWLTTRGQSGPFAGLAQQGESIAFTGEIPDCPGVNSITAYSLSVGNETAILDANIKSSNNNGKRKYREDESRTDDIRITLNAIYDMSVCKFTPSMEGALLKYEFAGKPALYNLSANYKGDDFQIKKATAVSIHQYEENARLEHSPKKSGIYLAQIQTDGMSEAATRGDLTVNFKYRTQQGLTKETGDLNVKDLVNEFYGHWPGNTTYFPYKIATRTGGVVNFILDLGPIDSFLGATISLGVDGDDYQFSQFKIYELTSLGERKADWVTLSKDGVSSLLTYTRMYDGVELDKSKAAVVIADLDDPVLIQPGKRIPVDFTTNTVEEEEDNKFDIDEYQIPYADAMKNFGFTTVRKDYEVTVKVYDDAVGSDGGLNSAATYDRDSGSNNHFFFQLVFEHGESGIVLANQLLQADRFQSGGEHIFHIRTNLDYGEVVGVRIIPDDITEGSTPYDKLNIERVSIIEGDTVGTHRMWEINNIDWVGINYIEEGEKVVGKMGRTLSDLTKTYPVDRISNVLELEFSLQTALGDKSYGINPATNVRERIYCDQFIGKAWADVTYKTITGETVTKPYDLVDAMYKYRNKTVPSSSQGVESDPAWMFREGHTDRFILAIPDVQSVLSMKITLSDSKDGNYVWNIAGISGRLVEKRGRLRLNKNDEYEYEIPTVIGADEEMTAPFTQASTTNPAYSLVLDSKSNFINITFNENKFKIDPEKGIATSVYSRLPVSKDDKLNVYVFPVQNNLTTDISSYDLGCKIWYAHPGGLYRTGEDKLDKYYGDENNRPMFYKTGLSASGMTDVNRAIFSATAGSSIYVKLDYAIVQQVRLDTVVATYFINLEGDNPYMAEVTKFPTRDTSVVGYSEYQTVALQLDAGTDTIGLYKERNDLAVSIDYKASFDPNGATYHSPLIYLTDQKINQIKDGKVVELKFEQFFVGEVTGINVVSVGELTANISSGYVATYQQELNNGESHLQGWYSFGTGISAKGGDAPQRMVQTANVFDDANSVKPLTLTFTTSGPSANYESGSRDPIRATIYTTDYTGEAATPLGTIPDLRKYIVEGTTNFFTGQTQKVKVLVTGAQNIRRIRIEPFHGDGTAGWSIDSASAQLGDDISATRVVGKRFYEGTPEDITFANITLTAKVMNWNTARNANDTTSVTNNTISIITPSGKPVYVEPTANGSELGVEVKVVEVSGESTTGNMSNYLTIEAGRYVFNTPRNLSGKTRNYRITASSVENPGAKVEINITVDSEDANVDKTYTVLIMSDYGDNSEQKKSGETVTIKAPTPPADMQFKRWLVQSGGASLANPGSTTTEFTMPANDVTIKAEYEKIPEVPTYTITYDSSCTGPESKKAEDEVTVTPVGLPEGYEVKEWKYSPSIVDILNKDGDVFTFKMPAENVTITAVFGPKDP